MPSYLDQYGERGAGEERRNKLIIRSVVSALVVIVITSVGWYLLKNRHQEGVVKGFLGDVRRGDLAAAYRDWGCTAAKPCSGYDYQKFLSDWGPPSSGAHDPPDPGVLGLSDSQCSNHRVRRPVEGDRARTEMLRVDKGVHANRFAPH